MACEIPARVEPKQLDATKVTKIMKKRINEVKWMNVENATKIKFFEKFSEILKETFITL